MSIVVVVWEYREFLNREGNEAADKIRSHTLSNSILGLNSINWKILILRAS